MTLQEFYKEYTDWSVGTFGEDKPAHGLTKLIKEAQEAKEQPDDMLEYADCLMCLLYAFRCAFPNHNIEALLEAANLKLQRNKSRKWIQQPDGTWQHDKTHSH